MDLCSLIERNAAFAPTKPALHFEGKTLTYAALMERIEQTARALKSELGVISGDRVAVLSLNRPDYLVLLYACARLGAILVPLNWRLAVAEQLFILADASAISAASASRTRIRVCQAIRSFARMPSGRGRPSDGARYSRNSIPNPFGARRPVIRSRAP